MIEIIGKKIDSPQITDFGDIFIEFYTQTFDTLPSHNAIFDFELSRGERTTL